jgi:hypothetical protein
MMSIANYVKQFLKESNKIVVQPVVVTAESDFEEVETEEQDIETIDEASPHAGGQMAAAELKTQISSEVTSQNKRKSQIDKQASVQSKGSKSITQDVDKSGNVSDYESFKDNESTAQSQRQADLNKLTTKQNQGSKSFIKDFEKSGSDDALTKGKDQTKKLKGKRQSDLEAQKVDQIGSEPGMTKVGTKKESMDFINKFSFNENNPQAGTSKKPVVEPSIGSEVKSGTKDSEKKMNARLATQEKLKKAQVHGKKITGDVQNTKSLETFGKGGDQADSLTNKRVNTLSQFNKQQHSGEKSIDQDLNASSSTSVFNTGSSKADSLQGQRDKQLAALQSSQKAEAVEQKSMDVFKGVENPNDATLNIPQGKKRVHKDKIGAKLEKATFSSKKQKDEAVYDAGNVKGIEGIDSRDDVSLPNGKYKTAPTKKTTTTKQAKANTQVPTEAKEENGKDVDGDYAAHEYEICPKTGKKIKKVTKDESQLVTTMGKEGEEAGRKNLASHGVKKESAEVRAEALLDSITESAAELPSDDILVAIKQISTGEAVELDESVHKSMVLNNLINPFNEITESSKMILKSKEARRRLAELSI